MKQYDLEANKLHAALAGDILAVTDRLTNGVTSFTELNECVIRLEKLIFFADEQGDDLVKATMQRILPDCRARLNALYCEWETTIENNFAADLLSGRCRSIREYPLYERFRSLVSKEVALVADRDCNRILFIGSGPFPITGILLHQLTGKPVDCLERDEQAACVSRLVLERLNLADQVNILVGDGASFDVSGYDLVLNALLAKPKWRIMKNIRNAGNPGCQVLCRTSYGLRQLLYESTPDHAVHGFNQVAGQVATYDETISTMLLVNKQGLLDDVVLEWIDHLDEAHVDRLAAMMNRIIPGDNNNGFLSLMGPDHPYFTCLKREVEAGLKSLLVIRHHDVYLGQLVLGRSYLGSYAHRAEVSTLMVDKAIRGKDISLRVVNRLLDKCESLGIEYITIDVREGSKVDLLWKYLGFIEYGILPCYSKVGGKRYKGIFMYQSTENLRTLLTRKFESLYSTSANRYVPAPENNCFENA